MTSTTTVARKVVKKLAPKEEMEVKEVPETKGKKEFKCQFYKKELGGCGAKCAKNRNICCYYCVVYEKCMTVKEIADEICEQVKECK